MDEDMQQLIEALRSLEQATKDVLIYAPPPPHVSTLMLSAALASAERTRRKLEAKHPRGRRKKPD